MIYNPAFAGTFPYQAIQIGGRFQWVGLKGAPMTQYLTFNSGFKKKRFGIGAHILNDVIGARVSQSIYADFGYNLRLNRKNHKLAFGISGGVDIEHYNFSDLYVNPGDEPDPFRRNVLVINPNFGAGIFYYGDNFFGGVSVPRILQNEIAVFDTTGIERHQVSTQHLYLSGGYTFKITNSIQIRASSMLKLSLNAPITADITGSVVLRQKFLIGLNYRIHESVGVHTNIRMGKGWIFGYAYDFPINELILNQFGTHELMIGFEFGKIRRRSSVSCFYF